ncbi:MAG: hypothetical protein QME71_02285 [Dehalococcoidia bacterium]|nr:hypothetical protein [Dehalococcoidia bacterium]
MLAFLLLYDRGGESFEPPSAVGEQALPGTPVAPEKLQEARDFKEFPLWWLGESFDSLNLRIHWATPDRGSPTMNSVYFVYGQCIIKPGNEGCPPPLQVIVEPLCFTPPEKLGMSRDDLSEFRGGAKVLRDEHGVRIWTGDSMIAVGGSAERVERAIERLTPLGNVSVDLSDSNLPPPNFDRCPPYVEPTFVPFPPTPTLAGGPASSEGSIRE